MRRLRLKSRAELREEFLTREGFLRYFDAWCAAALGLILLACAIVPPLRHSWVIAFLVGLIIMCALAYHAFMPIRLAVEFVARILPSRGLAAAPEPLPHGYRFGRYVVDCELPAAELGRVYKVHDTALGCTVAINVLAPALRTPEGRRRLALGLRRARQKPNPQAHEFGEVDGIPFVAVAYVEGVGAAVDVAKE